MDGGIAREVKAEAEISGMLALKRGRERFLQGRKEWFGPGFCCCAAAQVYFLESRFLLELRRTDVVGKNQVPEEC